MLPPKRLDAIADIIEDTSLQERENRLWEAIGGVEGLKTYRQQLRHVVAILQACTDAGLVKAEAAREIHELARKQILYTRIARIEEVMSRNDLRRRHVAAMAAIQYHFQVTARTLTLCQVAGAPQCILRPDALL